MTQKSAAAGKKALIIGAGTAGMASAITLSRIGIDIDLIDINPNWGALGAGLTITGPTLRALKQLGVYDEVTEQAYVGDGIQVCDPQGNPLRILPTPMLEGSDTAGSGGIMRPTMHSIMHKYVKDAGIQMRLGLTAEVFDQDDTGVTVTFSDGTQGRYDFVLGSDGVLSKTRQLLFPDAPKAEYTGQSCWRLFLKRPASVERRTYFLGGPVKVGFTPVSKEHMYMFLLERCPQRWQEPEDNYKNLKQLLEGYDGILAEIRESLTETDNPNINFRPLECFDLPGPWYVGKVLLIGDSAHPTTPQLASGAGMGIEDALVLAEIFEKQANVDAAFAEFMQRREQRCRLVTQSSMQIGRLEQQRAPIEQQTAIVSKALEILKEAI
ncbi:FAD-dependent monooxygenase [Acinetobacter kyonggiensis]|uniref:2-polyprenyl-6-methoxyphenol hydroxylase n=1 Tax=Acinetobacter kyonggiensis TaxID=595670 RepID=A0A1H3I066_9GAMM|nr:FAD-dependent monooxygenase [Acinetobacter kyonggiensis]SDY20499.1 2-polyprenyl-6-methoxyphenol hydroxylase [Acinetobacter kyonggiensis]